LVYRIMLINVELMANFSMSERELKVFSDVLYKIQNDMTVNPDNWALSTEQKIFVDSMISSIRGIVNR
jgi:hypothetical protein